MHWNPTRLFTPRLSPGSTSRSTPRFGPALICAVVVSTGCVSLSFPDNEKEASPPLGSDAAPAEPAPVEIASVSPASLDSPNAATPTEVDTAEIPAPGTTQPAASRSTPGTTPKATPTIEATSPTATSASQNAVESLVAEAAQGRPVVDEPPRSWSDLTRLAREHEARGELDEATERLDQAAVLVAALPPAHARRKTVFGLRARHALRLAHGEKVEASDRLADQLIDEAETSPEIGGTALVQLALSVADRREPIDGEGASDVASSARLRLLRVALMTSNTRALNRDRLQLASRIATEALHAGDLDLAALASNGAVHDTQILAPTRQEDLAWMLLERAQITAARGELEAAAADAIRANRLFTDLEASPSGLALGESSLASILAASGDLNRAAAIARGAQLRREGEEKLHPHSDRLVLRALGDVDRARGDLDRARAWYRQAIDVPGQDSAADRFAVRELQAALGELDGAEPAPEAESPAPAE